MPAHLDNVPITYDDLVKRPGVVEFYTDHLIADTGLFRFLQLIDKPRGNRNQMPPEAPTCTCPAPRAVAWRRVQKCFKGVWPEDTKRRHHDIRGQRFAARTHPDAPHSRLVCAFETRRGVFDNDASLRQYADP